MSRDDNTPTTISGDQFAQLMAAISSTQDRMDDQLAAIRQELQHGQEEAAAKVLKRVRREKPYAYKRKGNEEQSTFNEQVAEKIAEAQSAVERGDGPTT